MYYSYALSYCLSKYWSCWIWKELKRLMAYAGSSANLLTKLILQDHSDSYRWEVSLTNLSKCYAIMILLEACFGMYKLLHSPLLPCSAFFELLWTIMMLLFFSIEINYLIPNAFSFHPNYIKVNFLWYPGVCVPMALLFSFPFLIKHILILVYAKAYKVDILGRGVCGTWECKQGFPPLSFAWRFWRKLRGSKKQSIGKLWSAEVFCWGSRGKDCTKSWFLFIYLFLLVLF